MAVKECCIENCKSCSTRKEDHGVTYHKFPKDISLRNIWISVTQCKLNDLPTYVCSRHFCKSDFQIYKESKYVLKSDAIPSLFPWMTSNIIMEDTATSQTVSTENGTLNTSKSNENVQNVSTSSKESEENLDAIKRFIEEQDKEIQQKCAMDKMENIESTCDDNVNSNECHEEAMAVSMGVMDMILRESEDNIVKKDDNKDVGKQSLSTGEKGNGTMALSVGSRVEAKDFSEDWHPAQIVEVDYEEMEVLVRYEHDAKKHDEWINVSSPRLRPIGGNSKPQTSAGDNMTESDVTVKEEVKDVKVEKPEEKLKITFSAGERCLARWRDNRRFIATINNDLGNGNYEIVFDDGFHWTCNVARLYKWKPSGKSELTIDTTLLSSTSTIPSPIQTGGPSNPNIQANKSLAFHTHLFDPTRDYLGTKSERREMKRKLNIKEIFNIGQKRQKTPKTVKEKPKVVEKKPKVEKKKVKVEVKKELKTEIPDAVASIIGTVTKAEPVIPFVKLETIPESKVKAEDKESKIEMNNGAEVSTLQIESSTEDDSIEDLDTINTNKYKVEKEVKQEVDPVLEEEVKLEKFDKQDDVKHEEVIDRIKEVINKLEDGINNAEKMSSPKPEIKEEPATPALTAPPTPTAFVLETPEVAKTFEVKIEKKPVETDAATNNTEKGKKKLSKIKKGKKMRLLQEKKVKKQVEKVKSELEEMKKQVEEMRKQMLLKTQELAKGNGEMPASFMLPGEWCCKWVNGQPVGTVSEMECEPKVDGDGKPGLPRRSVQVEDKRLPPGWTKHMVRRSLGHSAGKWDVVLVSPENRRFHTKTDMRNYLENSPDQDIKSYEYALLDFGVHLKLSRRMGWISNTPGGVADGPTSVLPAGTLSSTSPLVKKKKLSLKRGMKIKEKKKRFTLKLKLPRPSQAYIGKAEPGISATNFGDTPFMAAESALDAPTLEDGYVYVGSLKVQIIENLLRCPAEGCFKNFRNNTLLKMHIKHYHRDLRKMLGATPKVLDLAYARTVPTESEVPRQFDRVLKVKIPRLPKRDESKTEPKEVKSELHVDVRPTTPVNREGEGVLKIQDSPKLRDALINKPVRRPKVLLPVRRLEPEPVPQTNIEDFQTAEEAAVDVPILEPLDFETAISTHTVTKPANEIRKKADKMRKTFAVMCQKQSEDEEWLTANSDFETRSSFPRSGTPDSKIMDGKMLHPVSSESNEENKVSNVYTYADDGEPIKIVQMKREEIINCHCGFREEDGLMVQCELCLCWQHALCHNIQSVQQVPEKYTCSICLSPRRGRRSQRFLHDQDRLYEGLLPGARPCDALRRSHELSGNLLRIEDALHALRVKYYVATKKDHPKLYLWAKDWEHSEITYTQEKLNSDYSDLNIMISTLGKENLPLKPDDMKDMQLDVRTPPSEEQDPDRYSQRESQLGSQTLLSGLLSSPGGASLDLPISTLELERLAKSVQEEECTGASAPLPVAAPQPEAAIENGACRERLLRHMQRCHALLDARLDSIEAQVAELESQDPSFEDDETADYFPRTKQTVQMLMRDLDTMEELGVIT